MGETAWPVDEEGNQIEGWIDGQLTFVEGKEKGECWNCGKTGADQRKAPILRPQANEHTAIREKGKEKANGKGRGKENAGTAERRGIDPTSAKIP